MRTLRTVKRKRESPRLRARRGVSIATVTGDMPRCATCGEPLARLPRFLTSAKGAGQGFQCQRCFYANAAPAPVVGETIASERTRWLTEVLSDASQARPPAPRERED
jgi:hypothetical protein